MPLADDLELLKPIELDELKSYADRELSGSETTLKRALGAAVLFCQAYTQRNLIPEGDDEPVAKTVTTRGRLRVRVPDVREITSVVLDGVTLAEADYTLLPDGWGRPAPRLLLLVADSTIAVITGTFGFLDVPADIRDAIYTDAMRRARDKDAGFADSVALTDGTVMSYFRTMPARVQSVYNELRVGSDFHGAA